MKGYILKRIAQSIPLVFGVIVINFVIIHLAPGDITLIMGGPNAPPEFYPVLRAKLGLDKPLWIQLFIYLRQISTGDLGYSWTFRQPVSTVIFERAPATLILVAGSFVIAILIGVTLGVFSSKKPYSKLDNLTTTFSLFGFSVPNFWLGILFILIFGVWLGWLPCQGMYTLGAEMSGIAHALDVLRHMILPVTVLALQNLVLYARLTRSGMLEVLSLDYITTAKAKGCSERTVLWKHALRNALLPVVTMAGLNLGFAIAGALITETVFAWPGVGRLTLSAIYYRDYPVIMGIFIVVSISVVSANLITDIIYALLDPRIRYK